MRVYGAICDAKRFITNNAGHIVFCAILCVFSVGIAVAAGVKLDCPSDYFEQEGGLLIVWVRGDCGATKYAILSAVEAAVVFAFMWGCSYNDFTALLSFASVFYRGYTRGFSLVVIATACGIKSVFLIVIDAVFLLTELATVSSCAVYVSRCDQRLCDGITCADDLSRTVLIMFAFYVCTLCLETVVLSALIAVIF